MGISRNTSAKRLKCPHCATASAFKYIGGVRPGLECGHCGMFYASKTWMQSDGTLVRRFKKPEPRSSYYDPSAWMTKGR